MSVNDHIGLYINMASMHIRRSLDADFMNCSSLSGLQGRVLCELDTAQSEGRNVYQKDMEHLFCTRRSSVNSLISTLEQNGYLNRLPDSTDARMKKLVLTEQGQQAARKIRQTLDNYEASLAALFSDEEHRRLISMLKRIIPDDHKCQKGCD